MQANTDPVRAVLIPISGTEMLLPNSAIAEIINYQAPEAVEAAPDWLLGTISWRGLQLKLFSIEKLLGQERHASSVGARISVMNRSSQSAKQDFFAIITEGIPHLVRLREGDVQVEETVASHGLIAQEVSVNGKPAFIPDLDYLESMVGGLS